MKKESKKKHELPTNEEQIPDEGPLPGEDQGETVTVSRQELEAASAAFEEAKQQRGEYLAMAQRIQAEFENYKRRNASLRTEAQDEGTRSAIAAILPSIDNLERALAAAEDASPLKSGVEMTLRGLLDSLAKIGLEPIACEKGDPFNPDLHNAVMTCEASDEVAANCIDEILQRGYKLGDKVIRYTMVRVAQ